MEAISTIHEQVIDHAGESLESADDYTDDSGLLMCGKCHTRKQVEVKNPFRPGYDLRPCMCACREQEVERRNAELKEFERLYRIGLLRRDGLTDPEYSNWTFERDDKRQPNISKACRKYVDEWAQMWQDNIGLLFFGGVGTGKSFYACCIANALLEMEIPTLVTSFPRILHNLQGGWSNDQGDLVDRLQKYELVVIDDLGAERNTEFALEQVYAVIDSRYRSGKPLIITTNLAPSDIKNPSNVAYARIYDRILQNSIPVKMTGASRRTEIAAKKREKYQEFLGL